MAGSSIVILESDHEKFLDLLEGLTRDSNAKFTFLLDRAGQQIASAGDLSGVDSTSLASLTAGNVAATEGVAQLVGETAFSTLYHEGQRENLHLTVVGSRVILLVVFDERSSLGLVRLRVGQYTPALAAVVEEMLERSNAAQPGVMPAAAAFAEITEDDIDALFG